MLSGAPLRYRPFSGLSQANAPAPSMPIATAVNTIVDRRRFVNCSCRINPPRPGWRSPEDFLPVTNVGVIRRPLVDPFANDSGEGDGLRASACSFHLVVLPAADDWVSAAGVQRADH